MTDNEKSELRDSVEAMLASDVPTFAQRERVRAALRILQREGEATTKPEPEPEWCFGPVDLPNHKCAQRKGHAGRCNYPRTAGTPTATEREAPKKHPPRGYAIANLASNPMQYQAERNVEPYWLGPRRRVRSEAVADAWEHATPAATEREEG